jgi:hypothetical protein
VERCLTRFKKDFCLPFHTSIVTYYNSKGVSDMRNELIVLILVFTLVLAAGCGNAPTGQQGQAAAGSGAESQLVAGQRVGLDRVYRYDLLKSYEYRIRSNATSFLNVKYTISPDAVNGTSAWLQQSELSIATTDMISKIWFSKATYKCLQIETEVITSGQSTKHPGQCPAETNSTGKNSIPEVTYIGKENVTVPLGTFSADRYSSGQLDYWVSAGIPVPVKVTGSGGNSVMELVSYS